MSDITPSFRYLTPTTVTTPTVNSWYYVSTSTNVPDTIAPYLAAHGYLPSDARPMLIEGEFGGWWLSMFRDTFDHDRAIQDMLTRMTDAYNEGRDVNNRRWEDLVTNFNDLIQKAQEHMTGAKSTLTAQLEVHMTTLTTLESVYATFFTDVQLDLEGLTVDLAAERTRANNTFDAQLSQSDQGLINRGFYSSAMISNIDAGIEERRQLALTDIAMKEAQLIADITHRKNSIYVDVLKMRSGLVGAQMELTNREQQFLAYQLDTRNNLAMALYKVVEGREDDYPGFGDQVALVSSLGDDT